MKMKTSELTGAALDWAVAKCEGHTVNLLEVKGQRFMRLHKYSNDWAQGGPIIEREEIDTVKVGVKQWRGRIEAGNPVSGYGPTPLIAAMRCYCASKLGHEVDVPDGLF